MFSAKQNIVSAANTVSNNKKKSTFIQPEMKVVKPDARKNIGEVEKNTFKEVAKDTLSVVSKGENLFFAPKPEFKEQLSEEEKSAKESEKEKTDGKLEQAQTKSENQSGEQATEVLKGVTNDSKGTQVVKTNAPIPIKSSEVGDKGIKKEGKEEGDTQEKKDKGEIVVKEKAIPKAPTKPEEDPAFQQQIKETEKVKEEKSKHPKASTKVGEQTDAGHASPAMQSAKNDQLAHAESMSATSEEEKKREPFKPETFKEKLKGSLKDLESNLPRDAEGAKEFKDKKPIKGIKENISGQVTTESDKLAGPMKSEADKPAPASGQPIKEIKPLPVVNPGATPKPLNAKAAIPKPKTSQEISMEKESQSLDDKMAENNVTDEQLAKSNEPKFTGALEQKNQAQTEAKLAPVRYRKKEQAQLGTAQKAAVVSSKDGLGEMQAAKLLSENNVLTNQTTNKTNDKTEKERIYSEFKVIYEETKNTVTTSLKTLSDDVDKKFDEEAAKAQKTFEKNVEDGLGEIYGWTVIDDWIFGEDKDAIDKLFVVEKDKFKATMDRVLDAISIIIAKGLNAALDAIEEGKRRSQEKFDSLDASEKKLGEDAFKDFNDQYNELEDTVYEKQDELAADLARSYKENVDSLQGKFDEIKDKVSAGWIGAAFNALAGVIKTILKIKDLLLNLLAAAVSAIGAIISDPIGFLSNLIQGVKQGFVDFGNNIKKHMLKGVIEWLTGSLGNVGITLPDNLFSLSGIFNLVGQMLGLTWDYFRSKAVKHLGEPVVAGMEKAVEIFTIVKSKGIMGLWEYIKEQFGNLKEMVMDAIRDMIITKVIEAGIKWVMGLLSPAGAFVKAAMMIIDIVKFFVERAAQIFELVTAFVNSIKALAAGNVKAVAKGIETALAKAIPILIGFLAALVGVTGLTGKVQKIVKKVRKKIDKAIDKIIFKAKKLFKGKGGSKKGKNKKGKSKLKDNEVGENLTFSVDGESHRLWIDTKGNGVEVMIASTPIAVKGRLNKWKSKKRIGELPKEKQGKANNLIKSAESLYNKTVEKGTKTEKEMDQARKKMTDKEIKEAEKADKETEKAQKRLMHEMIKLFEIFGDEHGVIERFTTTGGKELLHVDPTNKLYIYDAIEKNSKDLTEAKGIKTWQDLVIKIKGLSPKMKLIYTKPMDKTQSHEFSQKLHNNQASNALHTALKSVKKEEKKKEVLGKKKEFIDSRVSVIHGKRSAKAIEANTAIKEQITDKRKQKKTTNVLTDYYKESLKGNTTEEHDKYKPKMVSVRVDDGSFTIEYHYEVEIEGRKEIRKFFSHLQLSQVNGSQGVDQVTYGRDLVLKVPKTRGKTESINQIKANKALEASKAFDAEREIGFDASHVLADMFLGSGYKQALNLVTTSADYNRKTMKTAENYIKKRLKEVENNVQLSDPYNYITFDLVVLASWNPLTDSETIKALKQTNSNMTKKDEEGVMSMIVSDIDPKLCQRVYYQVQDIKLNGEKSIGNKGIEREIGPDETLKGILVKKKK